MGEKENPFTKVYPDVFRSPSKIGYVTVFTEKGTLLTSTGFVSCIPQDIISRNNSIFITGMVWKGFYLQDSSIELEDRTSYSSVTELSKMVYFYQIVCLADKKDC